MSSGDVRVITELTTAILQGDLARFESELSRLPSLNEVVSTRLDAIPEGGGLGRGVTLLQLASRRSTSHVIAERLLALGAELDVHSACGLGRLDWLRERLASEPGLLNEEVDTYRPLQLAIPEQPEILRLLLEHGDDVERPLTKVDWFAWEDEAVRRGLASWRLVHQLALHGYSTRSTSCLDVLAEHGADLNAVSPLHGRRPLHLAAMADMSAMVACLVGHGVDVDVTTEVSNDSIDWSTIPNGPGVASDAVTALMVAAEEGHRPTVEALLDLGADVAKRSSDGLTALDLALAGRWPERAEAYADIAELLRERSGGSAS
ncbi:MAG: ankyrin repeat domain-containing protein [Acidobacteriota bacterium]